MAHLRGRFDTDPDALMQRFSSSLEVDLRMLDEDIEGSRAHAAALGDAGVLTPQEVRDLRDGLTRVGEEIRTGDFVPDDAHEDVHMAVEARLIELLGDLGGKLHTARSRNDQCATDVRLWLKRRIAELDARLAELIAALLLRVEQDGDTVMPGYTHVQRGQPIPLGHHLLAHAWPLARDRERLAGLLERLDECPLGACAMAGTAFLIDRHRTAERLGFARPVSNAMDAVAARDHEIEAAAACTIAMVHMSRMAEELVWWSASEFGFVRLDDAHSTGSSIMPQKRNPDAAELVRGKAGTVIGQLQSLIATVKAQPMSYNRDLQETRVPLFDAVETTRDCATILAAAWRGLTVDADRFAAEMEGDLSLATEIADRLTSGGMPFRHAHEVVGRAVRHCEEAGGSLRSLGASAAGEIHPDLPAALAGLLDPRSAIERRVSHGGTASAEIERQVAELRATLTAAVD